MRSPQRWPQNEYEPKNENNYKSNHNQKIKTTQKMKTTLKMKTNETIPKAMTTSKMKTNKLIFFIGEVLLSKYFPTALLYFGGAEQHQHVALCVTYVV